jgi:hypothetical protein
MVTRNPFLARNLAVPSPIPEPPPVINTELKFDDSIVWLVSPNIS